MAMDNVRIIGRNTQGVRLINLDENEIVVGMSMLAREEEIGDGEQESDADSTD